MATMSAETQAIIDRLKAEGDLMRNTGTNSLKSVKVELGKFNDLFGVISKNIEAQTEALGLQAKIQADELEAQRTKEQFEELQKQKREEKEKETQDSSRNTDEMIEKVGDSITSALTLKNIALAAGGIFVGYNLLKGYINESTDGGFDKMINSIKNIEWQEMTGTFNRAYEGIAKVDFDGLANTVNYVSKSIGEIDFSTVKDSVNIMGTRIQQFNDWLGETGVGDIVTAVAGGALVTAGAKGAVGGVFDQLGKGGGGLKGRLTKLPMGLAMVTAGLAVYYGDEIKGWINGQMGNEEGSTGEQQINTLVNMVTAAGTLLAIFGPTPVGLAAAAVAVGVGLGIMIRDWIKSRKETETKNFNDQIDAAFEAAEAEADQTNLSEDTKTDLALAFVEARRRTQLAIGEAARAEAQKAQEEIAELLAQQQLASDGSGASGMQIEETVRKAMAGDQASIDELFAFAEAREAERGFISKRFGGTSEEWIRSFIEDMGSYLGTAVSQQTNGRMTAEQYNAMSAEQEQFDSIVQQILRERGYRRGTAGFKDFGSGTTAILHGKEAVVPLNSPEGQVLNNLYNGKSPADVVSNGAGMLGTTIINAPQNTVTAPVSVVDGGTQTSINSVTSMGGGSGTGPAPYGMTSGLVQ